MCFKYFRVFKKSTFHRVLEDDAYSKANNLLELKRKDDKIKKVVMCSGKIYFDLIEAREIYKNNSVTIIRKAALSVSCKNLSKHIEKIYKS